MNATPVIRTEKEPWGAASIIRIVNDGMYICTCSFRSNEYMCMKKHAFVYYSHFKPLHESKYCVYLIDNREDAHICVMEDKEKKLNLMHALNVFLGVLCTVKYFYKINPCK